MLTHYLQNTEYADYMWTIELGTGMRGKGGGERRSGMDMEGKGEEGRVEGGGERRGRESGREGKGGEGRGEEGRKEREKARYDRNSSPLLFSREMM